MLSWSVICYEVQELERPLVEKLVKLATLIRGYENSVLLLCEKFSHF